MSTCEFTPTNIQVTHLHVLPYLWAVQYFTKVTTLLTKDEIQHKFSVILESQFQYKWEMKNNYHYTAKSVLNNIIKRSTLYLANVHILHVHDNYRQKD